MKGRSLTGLKVNISVSESSDSVQRGYPRWQVNHLTINLTTALLGQGASVAFGHDWRDDGVMEAICGFAQQMQGPFSSEIPARNARMFNFLPWPDKPALSREERDYLAGTLEIREAGLPYPLREFEKHVLGGGKETKDYAQCRSLALGEMRRALTEFCDARICIGGRTSGFSGRFPGVIEEAALAMERQKPLYLVGLLGGAAGQVIDSLLGREIPHPATFPGHKEIFEFSFGKPFDDGTLNRETDPWQVISAHSLEGLSQTNGLSAEENRELFATPILDRAVYLILTGLSRLGKN